MGSDFPKTRKLLQIVRKIKQVADEKGVKFWLLGGLASAFYAGKIYREHGDIDLIVKNKEDQEIFCELIEELKFKKIKEKKLSEKLSNFIYKNEDGIEIDIGPYIGEYGLTYDDFEEDEKELVGIKCRILSKRYLKDFIERFKINKTPNNDIDLQYLE